MSLLPRAEVATVEGAGHLVASTHPAELAGIVLDFLRRHPMVRYTALGVDVAPPAAPP